MNLGNVTLKSTVGAAVWKRSTHKQALVLDRAVGMGHLFGSRPSVFSKHRGPTVAFTNLELERCWGLLQTRPSMTRIRTAA